MRHWTPPATGERGKILRRADGSSNYRLLLIMQPEVDEFIRTGR